MESKAGILDVLTEAIEALVGADARRLAGLEEAARKRAVPANEGEWVETVRLQRAFGQLLMLTRRNLRLLGSVRDGADGFEPGRG